METKSKVFTWIAVGAGLSAILGVSVSDFLNHEEPSGPPRFPESAEAFVTFNPESDEAKVPDSIPEFRKFLRTHREPGSLTEFRTFLENHAGERAILRVEFEAPVVRNGSEDPLREDVFKIPPDYHIAYVSAVAFRDACSATSQTDCPEDGIIGIPPPFEDVPDRAAILLDGDLYVGGIALAVQHNKWFRTQFAETDNGIRITGRFFIGVEPEHSWQLDVTPFVITPLGAG